MEHGLVTNGDFDNFFPDTPSRCRTSGVSNKFPPISPSSTGIFTPCAVPDEENRPKLVSSLTKLIHDSNGITPTASNSNSVDNSLHEFQSIYSEIRPASSISCDMLLKKALNELPQSYRDEDLSLFPAENDGVIMDDLPEFSRYSDVTSSGISRFIVVNRSNSQHLLHYTIDKVISENKVRSNSVDNYTILCMRPSNNQSRSQELKMDTIFPYSSHKQKHSIDYFNRSVQKSPTRSIVNSPTKLNEENESYESDFVHEVSSNDSFSDTWVESGSGKSEIVVRLTT